MFGYKLLSHHTNGTTDVEEFVLLLNGHILVFHCLISDEETYAGLVQQDLSRGTRAQRALRGSDPAQRTLHSPIPFQLL